MHDLNILLDFLSGPAVACPGRIPARAQSAAVLAPSRLTPSHRASASRASSDSWWGKASCKVSRSADRDLSSQVSVLGDAGAGRRKKI